MKYVNVISTTNNQTESRWIHIQIPTNKISKVADTKKQHILLIFSFLFLFSFFFHFIFLFFSFLFVITITSTQPTYQSSKSFAKAVKHIYGSLSFSRSSFIHYFIRPQTHTNRQTKGEREWARDECEKKINLFVQPVLGNWLNDATAYSNCIK